MNIKNPNITREELLQKLSYDPATGVFTWRVDIAKNVRAGSEAGCVKSAAVRKKTGSVFKYRYIQVDGFQAPAARVAWFMHYGEWPGTNIQFKNGDTLDLRIDNLELAEFPSIKQEKDGRKVYKMSKDASRNAQYKRYYGISLAEYGEMLLAQNGVCAICQKPEENKIGGKPTPLAVDHCHKKGGVRKLLCAKCNQGLGSFKDDPELLRRAAEYLELHCEEVA